MAQMPTAKDIEVAATERVPDSDFGGDSWREGLEKLLTSIELEGAPNALGIQTITDATIQFLVNRREMQRWYRDHPEIEQEVIESPFFLIGMVRTGTTALSFLLDQDPDNRSLLHWQAMRPCPPPELKHFMDDPRIAEIGALMGATGIKSPDQATYELLPDGPAECFALLGMEFTSNHFDGLFNIPSYTKWLFNADLNRAYEWHKKTLKLLQWRAPTKRWILKYPSHTLGLPAIMNSYPNARFIVTHRDPVRSIASVCSMIYRGCRNLWSGEDLHSLGERWTDMVEEQVKRMMAFRAQSRDDMFIDIHNHDLARAPMAVMERIYNWMGAEITPAARAGFERRIASNPKGAYGVHSYSPETYGLKVNELAERFRFYTEAFDVKVEH